MKSTDTIDNDGQKINHGDSFTKVLDGRKHPIRGLWIRGTRFYAQLTFENPLTGRKAVKRVPLTGKDGKPASTTAQAVKEMERLRVKRTEGDVPTLRQCPKLSEFVVTYLAHITAGDGMKKPSTLAKESRLLANWVGHIGHLRLDQIKPAHINSFVTKRLNSGLGARSVNLDVIALRCCLKHSRAEGWIQRLPMEGLRPLKVATPRRPFFSPADIERFCQAAAGKNGAQFADYIRLMAYSGARRGEALGLKWADVDFDNEQLHLRRQVTQHGILALKNNEARTVDFNAKLRAHLLEMKTRRAPDCDWVLPSPQRGERDVPVKTFRETLTLTRTAAGMPGFKFHDCRHTFVSMCVMSGIDFMTIAKWVGHKDGGVLIGKVYGHLANEHRKAMANKLTFEPTVLHAVNQ